MIHQVHITSVLNGFIVNVGCQTVVFDTRAHLLRELDKYLENPEETEKRFREQSMHSRHMRPGDAPPIGMAYRPPDTVAPPPPPTNSIDSAQCEPTRHRYS